MNLGLLLLKKSGRQGSLKFIITMIAAGLGTLMLLAIFSITNAVNVMTNDRMAWRLVMSPVRSDKPKMQSTSEITAPNAVVYIRTNNEFQTFLDRNIFAYTMHFTGGVMPKDSPLDTYPAAGEYYASPALIKLINSYPSHVFGDRFAGKLAGTIPSRALGSPDELVMIRGVDVSKLSVSTSNESMNAMRVTSFSPDTLDHTYKLNSQIVTAAITLGAIGLIIPIMLLITTATRLGAREREARYAALRLIGATKRQIRRIAFVDSLAASLAGVALGVIGYFLMRPLLFHIETAGGRFFAQDITVSPLIFASVIVVIVGIVWVASAIAMRGIIASPLGVVRKQKLTKPPRIWSTVPLALSLAGFAYFGMLDKAEAQAIFGDMFSLLIVGLFLLTMLSLLVAGGWLMKLYGALLYRVDKRASGVLVSRRISYEARRIFQGIGGIIVAFYAGTFFITSFATIVKLNDQSTPLLVKGIPDNSIFLGGAEESPALVALQTAVKSVGGYQVEPVRVDQLGGDNYVSCADAERLFRQKCQRQARYVTIPIFSTDAAPDMTRLTDTKPANEDGSHLFIYVPQAGRPTDLIGAETIVTSSLKNGNDDSPMIANSTLRAATINRSMQDFKALLYMGILLTVIVASLSLIVATVSGLFDRKGSFLTLRLTGVELPFLKQIVVRESMLPLVGISLISIACGFYSAYVFLRIVSVTLREAFTLPEPLFWACVVAVFALSYAGIRLVLPMVERLTAIEENRTE